jgi:hypothetical protein
MTTLPDWAVSQIVQRAGQGITQEDREQIIRSVSDAASYAFGGIRTAGMEAAGAAQDPHVLMRPSIYKDGNQWCALYGINLEDGVAGFGDSVALAMNDFDRNWFAKLAPAPTGEEPRDG